jgi:hypothetical protein
VSDIADARGAVCRLVVEDVDRDVWSFSTGIHTVRRMHLERGVHTVKFKFEKYDPHRLNFLDRAIIWVHTPPLSSSATPLP